jgi:D-3-phosphoglycerate dehydrogenase
MNVAVTSPSFSKHPELIKYINNTFSQVKLNSEGIRFSKEELINFLQDVDAAIIGLDKIDDEVLLALPNLRMIAKYGVGLDNIDLEACKKRGVKIGWTGGVNKLSVAEMVIGNSISLLRNIYVSANQLSSGDWVKNGGQQLSNKVIGIIGVGHIGKEVIRLLKPFNCRILVNDVVNQDDFYSKEGVALATKDEIYKSADVITIHTPFTSETKNLINRETLSLMKSSVVIINTARGGIVDENSLQEALVNHKIGGASLDVYEEEPPKNKALLSIPNLICTPHIGGNSYEAVLAMGTSAINSIKKII